MVNFINLFVVNQMFWILLELRFGEGPCCRQDGTLTQHYSSLAVRKIWVSIH